MIRKFLMLFAGISLLGSYPLLATDEPFNITALLLAPVGITETAPLDFGTLDIPAVSQTYTVNATAGPHSAGAAATAGTFDVTGANTYTADITLTDLAPTDTVGTTTLTFNLTLSQATVTFAGAAVTVYVGGSVLVNNGDDPGAYATTSTLQVIYQ